MPRLTDGRTDVHLINVKQQSNDEEVMKYSEELMCKYLLTDRTCPELILRNDCADFASGDCVIFDLDQALPKVKTFGG